MNNTYTITEIDAVKRQSRADIKVVKQDGVLVAVATHIIRWVRGQGVRFIHPPQGEGGRARSARPGAGARGQKSENAASANRSILSADMSIASSAQPTASPFSTT
jgi:hypothetical protein